MLYFFPRLFSFLLIYGGLEVGGVGGVGLGFGGWGFQLMGFWACGVGPSGLFGVGALYIITLGKNFAQLTVVSRASFISCSHFSFSS